MPEEFNRAVRGGAKVRTKKLPKGEYMKIAIKPSGKTVAGHVKRKKSAK